MHIVYEGYYTRMINRYIFLRFCLHALITDKYLYIIINNNIIIIYYSHHVSLRSGFFFQIRNFARPNDLERAVFRSHCSIDLIIKHIFFPRHNDISRVVPNGRQDLIILLTLIILNPIDNNKLAKNLENSVII